MRTHANALRAGWEIALICVLTSISGLALEPNSNEPSPNVILTYESNSTDIPAIGVEKDRVYFKFPTPSHPERIRGADASCSVDGDVTVWSFTKPSGMEPEFKQQAGRVELTWRSPALLPGQVDFSAS